MTKEQFKKFAKEEFGFDISFEKSDENMTLTEYMNKKYSEREDKDNMYGVGISDVEFRAFIIKYLLGKDWYVTDPLGKEQVNEIALYDILEKYSKRYRKERRRQRR